MESRSEAALALEQPVMPLQPAGKTPLGGLGLRHATRDPETIRRWWDRWPAANIGMRCDNLLVVDVDGDQGAESLERLERSLGCLPATRRVKTGMGAHRYFATAAVIGNSTAQLGHPAGVDLRGGARGYVVAPPSDHASGHVYQWIDDRPPAPLPAGWLERLTTRVQAAGRAARSTVDTAYGLRALESELERLLHARDGERNEMLNRSTFRLAQLVGGGELTIGLVEETMLRAGLLLGLSSAETRQTVRSAVRSGTGFPRARARDNRVSIDTEDNPRISTIADTRLSGLGGFSLNRGGWL